MNEFINDEKDLKKYISKFLEHYDIDMDINIGEPTNRNFYNITIGDFKLNTKITNGKFFVRIGGGWASLKEYIEKYIIAKAHSKRKKNTAKLMVSNLDKTDDESRKTKDFTLKMDHEVTGSTKTERKSMKLNPNKTISKRGKGLLTPKMSKDNVSASTPKSIRKKSAKSPHISPAQSPSQSPSQSPAQSPKSNKSSKRK